MSFGRWSRVAEMAGRGGGCDAAGATDPVQVNETAAAASECGGPRAGRVGYLVARTASNGGIRPPSRPKEVLR